MHSPKEWDTTMQPEQQQRIMGYFIEEAKDHLNTIEQGLLNLQSTIDDPEMVNEMFRAAHSVKGGAAMLGLNGIQHVSHRLEDFFKILKDSAVRVDQKMESSFLQVFDALKELVDLLQSPFGLTDESASPTLATVAPVFVELEQQLNLSVGTPAAPLEVPAMPVASNPNTLMRAFGEDVPAQLREMLALFKRPDADLESRRQLAVICDRLHAAGAQHNLPTWCHLVDSAKRAIAAPENSYRVLAPLVIRDIKQAQDLVLSGRAEQIVPGAQLLGLVPITSGQPTTPPDATFIQSPVEPDFGDIFADMDESDLDLGGLTTTGFGGTTGDLAFDQAGFGGAGDFARDRPDFDLSNAFGEGSLEAPADYDGDGPEVGIEELNTLADLFEGEVPDLGATWQEEELLGQSGNGSALDASAAMDLDDGGDFSDLLFEDTSLETASLQSTSETDLNDLFGDVLDDEPTLPLTNDFFAAASANQSAEDELSEFLTLTSDAAGAASAPLTDTALNNSELSDAALGEMFGGFDGLDNAALFDDARSGDLGLGTNTELDNAFGELDGELAGELGGGGEPLADAAAADASTHDMSAMDDMLAMPAAGSPGDPWEDAIDFTATSADHHPAELAELGDFELGERWDRTEDFDRGTGLDLAAANPMSDFDDLDVGVLEELSTEDSDFDLDLLAASVDSSLDSGFDMDIESLTDDGLDISTDDFFGTMGAERGASGEAISPTASTAAPSNTETMIQGEIPDPWSEASTAPAIASEFDDLDGLSLPDVPLDAPLNESAWDEFDLAETALAEPPLPENSWAENSWAENTLADGDDFEASFAELDLGAENEALDFAGLDLNATENATEVEPPDFAGFDFAETAPAADALDGLGLNELNLDAPSLDTAGTATPTSASFGESPDWGFDSPPDASVAEPATAGLEADDPWGFDAAAVGAVLAGGLVAGGAMASGAMTGSPQPEAALDFGDDLFGESDTAAASSTPDDASAVDDASLDFGDDLWGDAAIASDAAAADDAPLDFGDDLFGVGAVTGEPAPSASDHTSLDFGDDLFGMESTGDAAAAGDAALDFGDDLFGAAVATNPSAGSDDATRNFGNEELSFGFSDDLSDDFADNFADNFADSDFAGLGFDQPDTDLSAERLGDSALMDDAEAGKLTADGTLDFDSAVEPDAVALGNGLQADEQRAASDSFDDLSDFLSNDLGNDLGDAASSNDLGDDFLGGDVLGAGGADVTGDSDSNFEDAFGSDLGDFDDLLVDNSPDTGADFNLFGAVGGAIAAGAAGGMIASHFAGGTASASSEDFSDLDALLGGEGLDSPATDTFAGSFGDSAAGRDAGFDELDDLLKDAEEKMGGPSTGKSGRGLTPQARRTTRPGRGFSEQTMRVPVKHLDNLSNLVGELVVNRNSLEQDQERLRQSLDNLLYQVQQLSDVGQRMQDLYERSLLESSLLASRQNHRSLPFGSPRDNTPAQVVSATGIEYDPLEMDRFTGFHSLSQEMIELIVRVRESSSDIEFIVDETDQVTRMFRQVTTQLQEGLTRSRMVPFAQTADRLPRAVRDISMKVGKQVELVIEGRETLIDKMILEHLYDPMTHLVNNALTHGIESPDVRRAAGKPAGGRITVRAFHQGNQTIISVSDDGAGIDVERVKVKALEKGLVTPAEAQQMTRLDAYDLLFHAGFSTKDQADDFSGRGVGMDVVRTSLSEIRGVINTDSTSGKGTTFTIRLPLTLSISKALCCISDRARIAFPMDGVEDMLDLPKERIQTNEEGHPCIAWRDTLLPLHPLTDLLGYNRHLSRGNVYGGTQEDDIISVVVLRSAGNYLALQVDNVLGEQEIVIKQLEGPVPKPIGVAGATVLGDGRIMPIADVLELIDLSMGRIRKDSSGALWDQGSPTGLTEPVVVKTEPMVLIVDDSITVRELLSMTFNKVGYRVEQARDGQEAWEKLRSGLPCDIVFCDIEMPRMDGLELLSRIQKDPNLSTVPIAMLTSRGADRHRQMAASLGASGYFTKPYLEEALLDAAQRMLKGEVLITNTGNA